MSSTQSTQLEPSMDVASPCVGKCELNFSSVCKGCKRTRDEIAAWTRLSNSEKQQVIDRITWW